MSEIRVGVIGVGHLGYHHARNYASLPGVSLVGVVDADRVRGKRASGDFGVPYHANVQELLAGGVDAVSVAAPTTAHCPITLDLLKAGVDVLVEKPIAANTSEAREMVAVAARNGRILQVGHIERFNGAVMALAEAVRDPRFIECHRLSPYPSRGHDVSVVLDLMIHDLDIVLALAGHDVASIDAVGVAVFSPSEDIANARLRLFSGCVANLTCSRVAPERMRKIRVFEKDAYLSTDYSEQEVLRYRKKPGPVPRGVSPMEHILIDSLPVERGEPLRLELESFVHCVRDRGRPVVAGEDGLAALEIAEQIIAFIRQNQ